MRATVCFGFFAVLLATAISACGEKTKTSADTEAPREHADPHHGHDHAHDPHHGHDHGPHAPPPEPTNPYVYEPLATKPEPPPAPKGEPAGAMSFAGITFEVTIDGRRETLVLSDEIIAQRPGPIATWDCNPQYGIVNLVDFVIGDDPQKVGSTFVIRVDATKPQDMRAGTPTSARISIRRAGEPGLAVARGMVTWDPGYKSGYAVAQSGVDFALEVRWTCAEKTPSP